MDWTDKRPIADLKLGSEWEPKLLHFMELNPWPDSAWTYSDPPGAPPDFKPTDEFKAAQLGMWKRRMAGLPTEEALKAWADNHGLKLEAVRAILKACECETAEDIKKLGCTGVAAHHEAVSKIELNGHRIGELLKIGSSDHFSIEVIQFLRLGLAGSGVGLPCFVPATLYCLGHEVTGGLQDKQEQFYPQLVSEISRELQPEEKAHNELIMEAQHANEERGAAEMLRGRKMPEGWLRADDDHDDAVVSPVSPMTRAAENEPVVILGGTQGLRAKADELLAATRTTAAFECPEHDEPSWKCRYCVAQMIVEGDLMPSYLVSSSVQGGTEIAAKNADQVDQYISSCDADNRNHVKVFVLAANFTRKLAR